MEDYDEDYEDDDDEEDEDWESQPYFTGPCTCPKTCENYGIDGAHGWGACDGELSTGGDCPCQAGWEE